MDKNLKSYIKKEVTLRSLTKMKNFENDLGTLFESYDLSLRENTGRRNILVSQAQEVFFTEELKRSGLDVSCSGKTGEPDILIHTLGRELECKLTSSKKRSWPLQCDYVTLSKKGETDFLYVLSDESFNQFAVLFFDSLTIDDFHLPAPGSRQKSRMKKSNAMKKCVVLHGSVTNKSEKHILKYLTDLDSEIKRNHKRGENLLERIRLARTRIQKDSLGKMITNERNRHRSRKKKLQGKISFWKNNEDHYEISLESL